MLPFSLSEASSAAPTLVQAGSLVINLLGAGQLAVAQNFATSGIDRFADPASWSRLATGEPYLPAANAWMRGTVVNRMAAGGSTVVAVDIVDMGLQDGTSPRHPLVYHDRSWHALSESSRLPPETLP